MAAWSARLPFGFAQGKKPCPDMAKTGRNTTEHPFSSAHPEFAADSIPQRQLLAHKEAAFTERSVAGECNQMNTKPKCIAVTCLLAGLSGVGWAQAEKDDALSPKVDEIVRTEMREQRIPGVALAVTRNGKIVKAAGYGLANVELNVPVTPSRSSIRNLSERLLPRRL